MALLSKTTPPRMAEAVARPRLFSRLDAVRREGGALWLEGEPGTGKTTLVATWLRARRLRPLFLKVDEADKDPASFFHYLAVAAGAPRGRGALPVLTPEYAGAHEAFARDFFRRLFGGMRRGSVLVLDDLQEANGGLASALRAMLEEAVPSVAILLASRAGPPATLTRFRAAGTLTCLSRRELRFTSRETLELARRRGFRGTARQLGALLGDAAGWPAGTVLRLLDAGSAPPRPASAPAEGEYFAGEVLDRVEPAARRALLAASLLPTASEELLAAATGEPGAAATVAGLAERGLFVLRHDTDPPTYELHALFREFLRGRAERELAPERRAEVRRRAALRLAGEGEQGAEQAIELLAEAGAFQELAGLVAREAPAALREGRWQTVERWLSRIPEPLRQASPWLQLWGGVAEITRRPGAARERLARAQAAFEQAGEAAGVWLAWSAGVQAVYTEWHDFTPLAQALAEHERLQPLFPCPPGEVALRVLMAAHSAAMLARPEHPALPSWGEALRGIDQRASPPEVRLAAGAQVLHHEVPFRGEVEPHRELVRSLERLAKDPGIPPLAIQIWVACKAPVEFASGDLEACEATARTSLERGERHGLHAWDMWARTQLFLVALVKEPALAEERALMAERACRPGSAVDDAVRLWSRGLLALHRGDAQQAVGSGEAALARAQAVSYGIVRTLSQLLLARAYAKAGDQAAAHAMRGAVRAQAVQGRSAWLRCLAGILEAEALLDEGKSEHWVAPLADALAASRESGVHPFMFLGRADVSRLLAAALSRSIEPAHARELIRRWRLDPPQAGPGLDAWPWPLRIRALGPFAVEREGAPLAAGARAPRKPMELLRVLVARGGREVPEHLVAEALWPDAEADDAHHALETTLYRLRRLVGPDAVVQRERRLSLSPRHCWVDAFELEVRLGAALSALDRRQPQPGGDDLAERIADLYRGPLLAEHQEASWAREARERLRRRTARWLEGLHALAGPQRAEALRGQVLTRDPGLRPGPALRLA